jgi:hypothetical protein
MESEARANEFYEIKPLYKGGYSFYCKICGFAFTTERFQTAQKHALRHMETHVLEWASTKGKSMSQTQAQQTPQQPPAEAQVDPERVEKMHELLRVASQVIPMTEGKRNWVIAQLQDPEYRRLYARYYAWVERKPIPSKVLERLPYDVKVDLMSLWSIENQRYRSYVRREVESELDG